MKTLILGAGYNTKKLIFLPDQPQEFTGTVIRLDINPDTKPDIIWDLNNHPLPFGDNEFDEIHAYHVLEHLASQGDYKFFFREWNEYYRILKPEGHIFAVVPYYRGQWAWGDPGHTRILQEELFVFLNKWSYEKAGDENPICDYRNLMSCNFRKMYSYADERFFAFILKAEK
jgi:SAM-dependent methyltransferase